MPSALSKLTLLARAIVALIKLYQLLFSGAGGGRCIYTPSCSEYGVRAVRRFGAVRGIIVLCFRVVRCIPRFYAGGDDPLMERFSFTALLRSLKPTATYGPYRSR